MTKFDDLEDEFLESADGIAGVDPGERARRRDVMDKRSGKDLQNKWAQEDRSALAEAEALAAPPIISNPQCHVCQSPHRVWIERKLVQGLAYKAIASQIPDGSVSRKSISHHYREHMQIDQAVVRALLEEEAAALGQNVEEGVKAAFTQRGALEVLVRKGFQDALDGITTVEPRDLIQMMKLLGELNSNTASTAIEEARVAISIFKEAIQNVLVKGDIVEREIGLQLLQGIHDEATILKQDHEANAMIDRHLSLPAPSE